MSVKQWADLTPKEHDKLSYAWLDIVKGLEVYGHLTNATGLDDIIYEALWEAIELQK